MAQISPERLRTLRDHVLKFVYENGVSRPAWSVPIDDIQLGLNITRTEVGAVGNLLQHQGLLQSCPFGSIGLNHSGQAEAERLGAGSANSKSNRTRTSLTES